MTRKLKDMGLSGSPVKMPGLEFSVGDEVELRSDDDGYVGARFKAAVLEMCAAERRAKVHFHCGSHSPTSYDVLLTTYRVLRTADHSRLALTTHDLPLTAYHYLLTY
jgi:hypothetical protein